MMTRFLSSRRGSALESAAAAAAEPAGAGGRRGGRKEGRKETSGGGARRGDAAVTPLSVGAPSDPRPDRCAERRSALRRGDWGREGGGGEERGPRRAASGVRSSASPGSALRCRWSRTERRPHNKLERRGCRESRAPGGNERLRLAGSGTGREGNAGSFRILPAAGGAAPHSGWARGAVCLHAP